MRFTKKLATILSLVVFSHCGGTNTGNGVVTLKIELASTASIVATESFRICITGINYIINGVQQIDYTYMNSPVEIGAGSIDLDDFVYAQDVGTLSGVTLRINTQCDGSSNFSVFVTNSNGSFFIEDYVYIEQAIEDPGSLEEVNVSIDVTTLVNTLKAATSSTDVRAAFPN